MYNSTETEIKRVVLDILGHSKPNTCERCRHYDRCMDGVFKEAVHECCNHYGNHCGAEWDKEAELDRIDRVIAEDMLTNKEEKNERIKI